MNRLLDFPSSSLALLCKGRLNTSLTHSKRSRVPRPSLVYSDKSIVGLYSFAFLKLRGCGRGVNSGLLQLKKKRNRKQG